MRLLRGPRAEVSALMRQTDSPEVADGNCQSLKFKELRDRLKERALFDTPDHSGIVRLLFWLPMLLSSFALLHVLKVGWLWTADLFLASVGLLQMGFIGHDCGHMALSTSRRVNDWVGQLAMTALCGMSFGHWRHQHNRHHAHCQEIAGDPDTHYGILFSVYPGSASWHSALGRFFLAIQPYAFWPLTAFYWITLRYDAVRDLVQKPDETRRDRLFLPMHFLFLLVLPIVLVGWKIAVLDYVAVSCVSSVLTAAVFAPNHIGMPMLSPGQRMEFVEQQVTTSRNLSNPRWLDFMFGGLNAQIEHHLFPRLSSARLRRARPVVKSYCQAHQLAYREQSVPSALVAVVRHLHQIRAQSRRQATAPVEEGANL